MKCNGHYIALVIAPFIIMCFLQTIANMYKQTNKKMRGIGVSAQALFLPKNQTLQIVSFDICKTEMANWCQKS